MRGRVGEVGRMRGEGGEVDRVRGESWGSGDEVKYRKQNSLFIT